MNKKSKQTHQDKNFLNQSQDQKELQEKEIRNKSIIDEIDNIKNVKCTLKNIEEIKKKILDVKKEIKNLNLRHQANIENFEKTLEIELLNIKKEYLKRFFLAILPILDLLDTILYKAKKNDILKDPIIEGIVLTRNLFLKCLFDSGLQKIKVRKNSFFDDKKHEVNNYIDSAKKNTSCIYDVEKSGYFFENEVLRKTKVNIVK